MVLGVTTSGCGIGSRPPAAGQPIPATTSVAQPDPGRPADTPNGPGPASDPPRGGPTSERQFCQAISLNLSVLTLAASSPDDPSVAQGVATLRHLAETAPAQIKSDLTVIADFDQQVLDQIHAGRNPEIKETPELTAALSHEATWAAEHCA